jgi:hypothetical protein
MKFRKKPVVIDAMLYDGENMLEVVSFVGTRCAIQRAPNQPIMIDTLEGGLRATPGDWIIKGVKGEFYPCKPDIFEATYETAEPVAHEPPGDSSGYGKKGL